ncbi:MAG: alpha/beta hydrolase fold domain-containing protein [Pseudonocardiaceae bacterium]|nr:alpha/beta hydrolase fold domain-containing protein [Pseudonocardiaceae bacterium]
MLRFQAATGFRLVRGTVAESRRQMRRNSPLVDGPTVQPVHSRELAVPGPAGEIACRHFEPDGLAVGSPLLVYYHGGGWVLGDLDTHDNLCRFLALHAGVRVLSVDYRLAPEHPAPAAADDALAAYRYARGNAAGLGADPRRIAVGGDSAGGNLAAVTALTAAGRGLPTPAFLLMLYPGTDATVRRRSRDLFGDGFLLTDDAMTWFADRYVAEADRSDPRISPLLAGNLAELPPSYVVTAGFDPLRDEGEAFATALLEAGVPVVLRRHAGFIHGFANALLIGRFREAMFETAGALRAGLALCAGRDAPADAASSG